MSSLCVNCWRSYASLWTLNISNVAFSHFSPTCFDILSWNFAYDFVLLYYRSSWSVVNFCQFLWSNAPLECRILKITVFRTFLLHALTYRAESLHMSVFYCTTDQVRALSISVNFCGVMPLWNVEYWKYTVFPHFSLTRWLIELKLCISLYFTVRQVKFECRHFASIFVRVMTLLDFRILEIHCFLHFSLTQFDILSWNFAHDFVLLYYRSS